MAIIIYLHHNSQPCRAVLALCNFLKIPYEIKEVKIYQGGARTKNFKAMNPLGKVPTIVDEDGTVLGESHTILRYLCRKYKAPNHFYPNDPLAAAKIDQYLDWHSTNTRKVYNFLIATITPFFPPKTFDYYNLDEERESMHRAFKLIESFWLKNTNFIGSDEISIADISAVSEIMSLVMFKYDLDKFPKLKAYLDRVMKYEEMQKGHEGFYKIIDDMVTNKRLFPKL